MKACGGRIFVPERIFKRVQRVFPRFSGRILPHFQENF